MWICRIFSFLANHYDDHLLIIRKFLDEEINQHIERGKNIPLTIDLCPTSFFNGKKIERKHRSGTQCVTKR
jgi:hypothetical protein